MTICILTKQGWRPLACDTIPPSPSKPLIPEYMGRVTAEELDRRTAFAAEHYQPYTVSPSPSVSGTSFDMLVV